MLGKGSVKGSAVFPLRGGETLEEQLTRLASSVTASTAGGDEEAREFTLPGVVPDGDSHDSDTTPTPPAVRPPSAGAGGDPARGALLDELLELHRQTNQSFDAEYYADFGRDELQYQVERFTALRDLIAIYRQYGKVLVIQPYLKSGLKTIQEALEIAQESFPAAEGLKWSVYALATGTYKWLFSGKPENEEEHAEADAGEAEEEEIEAEEYVAVPDSSEPTWLVCSQYFAALTFAAAMGVMMMHDNEVI